MSVPALSGVMGRISSIQSRFGMQHGVIGGGRLGAGTVSSSDDFASVLANAETTGTSNPAASDLASIPAVPTSPTVAPGSTTAVRRAATGPVGGAGSGVGVSGTGGAAFLPDPVALAGTDPAVTGAGEPLEPIEDAGTATHVHDHARTSVAGANASEYVHSVPFADVFNEVGERYGISPRLLAAVGRVESNYRTDAVSSAGAIGVMQLMPATAAQYGVDPWDPEQAIDGAARLLVDLHDRFGSVDLALGAYNVGPGTIARAGDVPVGNAPNYIRRVHDSYGSIT